MKRLIKALIPKPLIAQLHRIATWTAAARAGFPSRKLIVIGVTGTNGKSTTVHLIAQILEAAGHTVGYATTVDFKVGEKTWLNTYKMTMLGRARLQKLLSQMVEAGCHYAIIETSSEGLAQYRHAGIDYDVAVVTNLTPEHIESHGSFKAYQYAKARLMASLKKSRHKHLPWHSAPIKKVSVVNLDDEAAGFFLSYWAEEKYGFSRKEGTVREGVIPVIARGIRLSAEGSDFRVEDISMHLALEGMHNIENAMAALTVAQSQGVALTDIQKGLAQVRGVPGRMEWINEGQSFKVLIDYAPEVASFEALYRTVDQVARPKEGGRIIHVLGSAGGGRDKARRPILGRLAGEHADIVIVTNEDPYDEDPQAIIDQVAAGAREKGKEQGRTLFTILDRKEAIWRAFTLAQAGDLVILTGKGAEQAIMGPKGTSTPWDEREVAHTLLKTLQEPHK